MIIDHRKMLQAVLEQVKSEQSKPSRAKISEAGRKRSVRGLEAEEAIIVAAERAFADDGIENASLRQIAFNAGCANNYAVQYHFKTREGLIDAIFQRRLTSLEKRRVELAERVLADGRSLDLQTVLEIIWRPVVEQRDDHGRHTYAAFIMSLWRTRGMNIRMKYRTFAPLTDFLGATIGDLIGPQSPDMTALRYALHSRTLLDIIFQVDQGEIDFDDEALLAFLIEIGTALLRPQNIKAVDL